MPKSRNTIELVRYFAPELAGARTRCAAAVLLAVVPTLLGASLLWAVKFLVDDVFVSQNFAQLPLLLAVYLAIGLGRALVSYVASLLDASIAEQISQRVRARAYAHVIGLAPGSLPNQNNGDLLTRLSGDAERVETLVYSGPLGLVADVIAAVVFTASLIVLSWKLTLVALLVAPLFLVVSLITAPRIRRVAQVARRQDVQWMDLAETRLNALPTIQAAHAEGFEKEAFERSCDRSRRAELRLAGVQASASAMIDVCGAAGGLVLLGFGAYSIQSGEISAGALIAFLGALGSLYGPIRSMAKAPARFQQAAARVQRLRDLLETRSLVRDKANALHLVKCRGSLQFDNVGFAYPGGERVLDGVSLTIEPGEVVAVVGPSGCGKSTLIKLALRLFDPAAGTVRIDGHDLRDLTLASIRTQLSVSWQDPHLFSGSIAQNIVYNHAGPEPFTAAGDAAQVAPFLDLRRSYEAPVGPAGRWLSGGQRQRVALARALHRRAPILLLDEATAAVDTEIEERIHTALTAGRRDRATLIVAHRLSSIRCADRIVVMEGGRIVESGPPALLLGRDTRCRALFSAQLVSEEVAA